MHKHLPELDSVQRQLIRLDSSYTQDENESEICGLLSFSGVSTSVISSYGYCDYYRFCTIELMKRKIFVFVINNFER